MHSPGDDIKHMHHALRLSERGLGRTWPNPSVGAVLVKHGAVVGRGVTGAGGRPHGETVALQQAGENARGATLYVTLEPCAHQGKTPPCTDGIIAAGVVRVVAACVDSNPKVAGKGLMQLREAGVTVEAGVLEKQARTVNEGFFSTLERRRPFVSLKLATSLDGKIATADSESRWITQESARRHGHLLRATHDAILTGMGTVLADDPQMNCRIPGREAHSPLRVALDAKLRMPFTARCLPAWIFTSEAALAAKPAEAAALRQAGATLFTVPLNGERLALAPVLARLAEEGITRLLVEAGSTLSTAFLRERFADRLYWYRAPIVIGEKGLSALPGDNLPLGDMPRYKLLSTERLGEDVLEVYDCPLVVI